ncbi:MAG: AmmeMemoRadiSam system radical SAM enzyme [Candidatus Krumholzibacteriota bacterium]|nr:AmmeMemoRadiSam system radical SAM enzyme [Candidatus Krumholzibacteriota bacterium]
MVEKLEPNLLREIPSPGGEMSRRSFITGSAAFLTCALGIASPSLGDEDHSQEASYYRKLEDQTVQCLLCPHGCVIPRGERGICGNRENRGGILYSLVYGYPCSIHLDPIEKKPFFHVLPGTSSLSLSTVGCNMTCRFCQNWQISQSRPEDADIRYQEPAEVVKIARDRQALSIAYTYGEPVVFFEYMAAIARLAKAQGIRSVVVTNGYYAEKPLSDLCRLVDAIKIDLKAYDDTYYQKICGARLQPVLDSLVRIKQSGVWLEIVYLMIPTLNDQPDRLREMSRWLFRNLGPDVPVHFSRFYPQYRLNNLPPTPLSTLEQAWEICRQEGMRYVYLGNIPPHRAESTYCPFCEKKVISRNGYRIEKIDISNGNCRFCGKPIPGLWGEDKS